MWLIIEVGASEILYIDKESDFIEVGASLNFDMDKWNNIYWQGMWRSKLDNQWY